VVIPSKDDEQSDSDSYTNTRRQFVAGSAGALGGLAVGGTFAGSALAQEDEEPDDDEGESESDDPEEVSEDEFEDDVEILNYALTLEYLEAEFYRQGLENISEDDLCTCKAIGDDSELAERVYEELETIREHEETHVETLASVVEDLGGEPIEEPEFDFGLRVEFPMAFLATAVQLEDTGVSAYAGAAPSIENEDLIPPALSIHSVEARHASFLRTLTAETSFPNAFDEARSRSEVLDIAGAFIVGDTDPQSDDEDDVNGTSDDEDDVNGTSDDVNGTSDDVNGTTNGTTNGSDE
jgi:rubrerythrin